MPGRIPKQFIDDLLMRVDIVDLIDSRVPLKKAGKDHKACCPFHDEKTASFTVSPTKQFYHCFGCGAHGTAISFLMEYERMSFPEAVTELAARAGVAVPQEAGDYSSNNESTASLLTLLTEAARFYRTQLREHAQAVAYLKNRGITGEIAATFGIGFAPDGWDNLVRLLGHTPQARDVLVQAGLAIRKDGGGVYDRFRGRVMFPIHDYRGRIVGFGGRVIDQGEPKYLNSPETALFHKGQELYGLYRARESIRREGRVLVVEGYMDVVALAQHGVDNAIATLGTATTADHLNRIFRFAHDVIFCFDGDRAGREAAWKALDVILPLLSHDRQAGFLFLPDGEDPDTLVRKEGGDAFGRRILTSVPVPEFFFQGLAKQVDLNRRDARARLAELAKPYLSKVPAGVLKETMLDRLNLSPVARQLLSDLARTAEPSAAIAEKAGNWGGPKAPPSMVRIAIALLVQHPELVRDLPDQRSLEGLELPGMDLFHELSGLLQTPHSWNTAAVVEHFRGSTHEQHIAKLAVWEHPALAHDVGAEFQGLMQRMAQAARRAGAERLLRKQQLQGSLTATEKAELAQLLADRLESEEIPSEH